MKPKTKAAVTALLIGSTAAMGLLTSCVLGGPPDEEIGNVISAALHEHEDEGSAVIDLDQVVPGNWTRVVVACYGADRDSFIQELKVPPDGLPDTESPGFLSIIVFVDDNEVIHKFNVGQDDMYVNHWYFTPCASPIDPSYLEADGAIYSMDRSDSSIFFQFSGGVSSADKYWYVPAQNVLEYSGSSS